MQIQPGVNQGSPSGIANGARVDDRRPTSTVIANGQSDYFNNQLIDGLDNNEREQGFIAVHPSIDAIAEVKVDTNVFSAEVGRSAGAVVNIITKSGTNAYHGTVYEYFRNDIFDARSYFARVGITPKPEYRQNQFGGSIGGPIIKNKTFFFADAEDNRQIIGNAPTLQTVPTLYEEQHPGDFTDIKGPFAAPAALDKVGLAYFKLFPAPNVPGATTANNYASSTTRPQYTFSADGRIDHHFNNGDTLFGRYSYNNVNTLTASALPPATIGTQVVQTAGGGPFISKAHGVALNYVHLFTPNLVLELKTGYTRIDIESLNANHGVNASDLVGLINGNTPLAAQTTGLTPVVFQAGGYAGLGDGLNLPIIDLNNTFQYLGSVSYTHGPHNLKFGEQLTRRQLNYFQSTAPIGYAAFAATTGNALEDLLLGKPLGYTRSNNLFGPGYRAWENSVYAQDDWRVNSRLTLNLGVRYDFYPPFTEAHNRYSNFDYTTLTIIQGSQDPHIGIATNYANVAPRVGFSQSLSDKAVIRGGFGISFYPLATAGQIQSPNPPYQYSNTCLPCTTFVWPILPVPVPSSATSPAGQLRYETKDFNTAYTDQFNLTFQQQFGQNVFTLSGVGELTRHLLFQPYINIPNPNGPYPNVATQGPPKAAPLLTAAQLPAVGLVQENSGQGVSNYFALQSVIARRFSKGFALNANYTWARGLSDAVSSSSRLAGTGLIATNPGYDYGNSSVDIRHRVAINVNYQLPFGENAQGARALLLKGWAANSIAFWQTGQTFTVVNSFTNKNGLAQINLPQTTTDRPSVTGTNYKTDSQALTGWLNLNAFMPQDAGTAGNEASGQFYGPHTRRVDLSMFKTVNLPEKMSLQFRAECYNISNTPNFAVPNSTISNWNPGPGHTATTPISVVGLLPGDVPQPGHSFGTITSVAANVNPRQFQFALKLLF